MPTTEKAPDDLHDKPAAKSPTEFNSATPPCEGQKPATSTVGTTVIGVGVLGA